MIAPLYGEIGVLLYHGDDRAIVKLLEILPTILHILLNNYMDLKSSDQRLMVVNK